MIDSTVIQTFANQTISVINAVTGFLVAVTTAAAYLLGHRRGQRKGIKNEGTGPKGH